MTDGDAAIVAHSAQYVDDATNDGALQFKTGERYVRVTSAHKTLDLRANSDEADNRLVWAPFHFLPGGDTAPPTLSLSDQFIRRMVCRPDSEIAQNMIRDCVEKQQLPFGLHRFGVALHTYVDTWAHQGFVGMVCDFNKVDSIEVLPDDAYKSTDVYKSLTSGVTKTKAHVANFLSVGHAGVLTFPDMPFAQWSFTRESGEQVSRNNPKDFLVAATRMFNMARRYVAADFTIADQDFSTQDKKVIDSLLRTTIEIGGEERHSTWKEAVKQGQFSFGPAEIEYVEQGAGSWKYIALGTDPDDEANDQMFDYSSSILSSNWKRFHDAVQYQRLFVLHDLLPRYGICAS